MAVHSKDEALMCKVFPSSLGLVAMRWFDNLKAGSIDSFRGLTQAFDSRFITCSRVPWPLDSLLSLSMRDGETLKTYSDRYWKMYNEIDGDFDDVAISTFKSGLPTEHGLRKFLTGKLVTSLCQLIDRIDKYKRVEEDQQRGKGKDKVIPQEERDFRSDQYNNNRPRRDFARQSGSASTQMVNAIFRELVHQVLKKIKKDCRNLWDHLDQLVQEGKLKHLLHHSSGQGNQIGQEPRRDAPSRPPLDMINVIFAALGRTGSCLSRVMTVSRLSAEDTNSEPKRAKVNARLTLSFTEEDKVRTIQPHDDALVVTLRIGGYDVKRVMVDQGSGAKIMYPDLYKRLNLRPKDLTAYSSPLVSFDGKVVIPRGQIRLPIQTGSEVVEVDFIVVDAYSPYTAIVGRP
ncbi:uncharacterized protein LOC136071561 [Quercus suber]|uniref:uncharacterized protein LOC136071561 n=1 Tax=Quercus suber TaxID=58331 RepID=UPI0032DF74AC